MANEIYHESEWGEAEKGGFGDIYLAAHYAQYLNGLAGVYENADYTLKSLERLKKATFILTPTVYPNTVVLYTINPDLGSVTWSSNAWRRPVIEYTDGIGALQQVKGTDMFVFEREGFGNYVNESEGVWYVEMRALSGVTAGRLFALSDGTNSNKIVLGYGALTNQIIAQTYVGGVLNGEVGTNTLDTAEFHKIAYRWRANEFDMWIDGVQVAEKVTGSVLPTDTITGLEFRNPDVTQQMHSEIRSMGIFSEYLEDDYIQKLTS